LNPGTVNKHLAVINNVLEDAANEKALIPHNPARLVARARGGNSSRTAVVNCLTAAELEDLLSKLQMLYSLRGADDATKNKRETIETLKRLGFTDKEIRSPKALHKFKVVQLYPIVYLAAMTGMRLSELLALKWVTSILKEGRSRYLKVRTTEPKKMMGKVRIILIRQKRTRLNQILTCRSKMWSSSSIIVRSSC